MDSLPTNRHRRTPRTGREAGTAQPNIQAYAWEKLDAATETQSHAGLVFPVWLAEGFPESPSITTKHPSNALKMLPLNRSQV